MYGMIESGMGHTKEMNICCMNIKHETSRIDMKMYIDCECILFQFVSHEQ